MYKCDVTTNKTVEDKSKSIDQKKYSYFEYNSGNVMIKWNNTNSEIFLNALTMKKETYTVYSISLLCSLVRPSL